LILRETFMISHATTDAELLDCGFSHFFTFMTLDF
jgi:hypothetical protein